jgi:hypothetical protein
VLIRRGKGNQKRILGFIIQYIVGFGLPPALAGGR